MKRGGKKAKKGKRERDKNRGETKAVATIVDSKQPMINIDNRSYLLWRQIRTLRPRPQTLSRPSSSVGICPKMSF